MSHKTQVIIEIIIVIGLFVWYTFQELIPDLKTKYGSSDTFLNTNSYQSMIELNIDNKVDFSVLINKEKKVYHIFFFNENSTCLYNENIENNTISQAINKSLSILELNNYLNDFSTITITKYNDSYYEEINQSIREYISKNNLNITIIEIEKSLEERREELGIRGEDDNSILQEMDYYSKGFSGIGNKKR